MKAITETGEPGFRHKIGTELYGFYVPDASYEPEQTVTYTIVKRTERYVYVSHRPDRPEGLPVLVTTSDRRRLVRFSIDELERTGRGWNQAHRMSVYTRPLPHWPLMAAVVRKPEQLAIGGGS